MKGRYFLDMIDEILYSTNSYTLFNFYRSIFYGKPFPGELTGALLGAKIDWMIITHMGKILMRKINGKYVEVKH